MTTLIIHLTDAHLRATDKDFPQIAETIAAAALSEISDLSEIHVILSGDLVQSGKVEEFNIVTEFLQRLVSSLKSRCDVPVHIISCPGNHDCDFDGDQRVREIVRKDLLRDASDPTGSVIATLEGPLANYYTFAAAICSSSTVLTPSCRVLDVHGEHTFRYVIFNSALMSQKKEQQGELRLFLPSSADLRGADRIIFVMHHPLNWIHIEDARSLAALASETADIFLFGHEHQNGGEQVRDIYSNLSTCYLHGQLLNGRDGLKNSGFETVEVLSDGLRTRSYQYESEAYRACRASDIQRWIEQKRLATLPVMGEFATELNDPGANFTHRRKASIFLDDIFVWPELRFNSKMKGSEDSVISKSTNNAKSILVDDFEDLNSVVVIKGGEQYGKTALTKMLFKELRHRGVSPLLLDGAQIPGWTESRLGKRIDMAVEAIYGRKLRDTYMQMEPKKKVLIIDNFSLHALADAGFEGVRALSKSFGRLILMVNAFPGVEIALSEFLKDDGFVNSDVFELQQLSYATRQELIERWLSIGAEESETEYDLGVLAARMARLVDESIGRNFIPAIPLFILIILQRLELEQDLKTVVRSGAHGFLYEVLINQAISTNVSGSLSTITVYLSQFAQALFESSREVMSSTEFARFHALHCERYDLEIPLGRFLADLSRAKIVVEDNAGIRFKMATQFHYFLARSLATRDWLLLQPVVSTLVKQIHTEMAANVLLFLAHFSRSPEVATLILNAAKETLPEYSCFDIFSKNSSIGLSSVTQIRQALTSGTRSQMIDEAAGDADRADGAIRDIQEVAKARLKSKLNDALAMNAAFKTLQILGQLLRNSAGSIERSQKRAIAAECSSLGLRALGFMHELFQENGGELLEFRALQLRAEFSKRHLDGTLYRTRNDTEIAMLLESYVPGMFANVTVGTLVRVANALGSEELLPTLSAVLERTKTGQLILHATKLEHFGEVEHAELKRFGKETIGDRNPLAYGVLRRFIIRRLVMFPVSGDIKENLASAFNLSIQDFRIGRNQRAVMRAKEGQKSLAVPSRP